MRDIVPYRKHGNELPAKVEHEDEQQRQRQLAPARPGEGGQDDEHEDYARSAQQRRAGKERPVQQSGYQGGRQHCKAKPTRAVACLTGWADDKEHQHVADVVLPARVSQHMQHEAGPGQGLRERRAVYAEEQAHGPAARQPVKQQHREAEEGEAQDERRIIAQTF